MRSLIGAVMGRFKMRRVEDKTSHAEEGLDSVASYWNQHNVTLHRRFASAEESLEYFDWRNDQYFDYITHMPVRGHDALVVLDYGCGPGDDLVGFGAHSKPSRLIGMDVSPTSVAEARARLQLHQSNAEVLVLRPEAGTLPLPDASVDLVHCSGVLHHIADPMPILREFRRVLRKTGRIQVMVYNRASLWMHLYCAYHLRLVSGAHAGETLDEVFRRSTDGEQCPVSRAYDADEFIALARDAGFEMQLRGVAVSAFEMSLLPTRFAAIMDERLPPMSRKFLAALQFDDRGLPVYRAYHAGIDACFGGTPSA